MASRQRACCIRLAMNPGTSFLQRTGFLPTPAMKSMTVCAVSSEVASLLMTSTRGIRCPGFQKCVPQNLSRCFKLAEISEGLITELLVQKMVSGLQSSSSFANISCLSSMFSAIASTTRSAFFTFSCSRFVSNVIRLKRSSSSSSVITPFSISGLVLVRIPPCTSVS